MMRRGGTRFLLYPQAPPSFAAPELVWIDSPPGSIGPGPSDARFHAILPALGKQPYLPPLHMPPFSGPVLAPAMPDAQGHFDHLDPRSPQFLAAHLFAAARFTVDVWEGYLGAPLRWWHADRVPRLELIPTVAWNNAHSGPGYIETGTRLNKAGEANLFCLNLDVVAHEIGHAIVFSVLGIPSPGRLSAQYLAFHESFSDLVALVTALQFDSVIDRFLDQAWGNLYALSLINRVGELSDIEQIRAVDFAVGLAAFDGFQLRPDGGWNDPSGQNRTQHQLSQPLTAAIFCTLIEVFQDALVRRGVIAPDDDARGWDRAEIEADLERLHRQFQSNLARLRMEFRAALHEARDWTGRTLARTLRRLSPETLTFQAIAQIFLSEALADGTTDNSWAFTDYFRDRDIEAPPVVTLQSQRPRRRSHLERVLIAEQARTLRTQTHRGMDIADYAALRRLMPHGFRAEPGW